VNNESSDESNEEHEHHHHPIFAFQMGPPPEVLERMQMENEANAHETRHFLDSLTEDQLIKLGGIMQLCFSSNGAAAGYYQGVIIGILDYKYKVCLSCGRNHEEEFHEAVDTELPLKNTCCDTVRGRPHSYECSLMVEYGLEPDDNGSEHVQCKNCKQWYPSLEDRMLRPPGVKGCSSCQQKAKWG
jgi:hypothetical protein